MMQDPIGIPAACFSSAEKPIDDQGMVIRSGQSMFMSVYRTKMAGYCHLITITWYKNLLLHGLSVWVEGLDGDCHCSCKIELKPWYFWRRQGSKHLILDGKPVDVYWDLKAAKFNGETEPQSDYYVALVCEEEVVLLVGDLKKDAFRKTGSRPALIEPILISKREHIFGKKKFSTRVRLHEKGRLHEISIECNNKNSNSSSSGNSYLDGLDPEMEIRVDGYLVIHVKHLQWKFRGNESIYVNKIRIEVCWDVHDWLFSAGLRHAIFIFTSTGASASACPSSTSTPSSPMSSSLTSTSLSSQTANSPSLVLEGQNAGGSSGFCLFLYAWKTE